MIVLSSANRSPMPIWYVCAVAGRILSIFGNISGIFFTGKYGVNFMVELWFKFIMVFTGVVALFFLATSVLILLQMGDLSGLLNVIAAAWGF